MKITKLKVDLDWDEYFTYKDYTILMITTKNYNLLLIF